MGNSSETDYNGALLRCGVTIQSDGSENFTQTTLGMERLHATLAKSGDVKSHIAQWPSCIIRPSEEAAIVGSDSPSPERKKKRVKSGKMSASCP